jgi:hypothetical protein
VPSRTEDQVWWLHCLGLRSPASKPAEITSSIVVDGLEAPSQAMPEFSYHLVHLAGSSCDNPVHNTTQDVVYHVMFTPQQDMNAFKLFDYAFLAQEVPSEMEGCVIARPDGSKTSQAVPATIDTKGMVNMVVELDYTNHAGDVYEGFISCRYRLSAYQEVYPKKLYIDTSASEWFAGLYMTHTL